MKVLHVCHSDSGGGAAIGAYRLHTTMLSQGIDSRLLVVVKRTEDDTVIRLPKDKARKLKKKINDFLLSKHKTANPILRSLNIFGRGAAKFINKTDADVIQMHWVNLDTVSISEISKIKKPLIWKLPDMWAFSGAEHYMLPDDLPRYRLGYKKSNFLPHESGLDLNRLIWKYKKFTWKDADFSIVCPSKWLTSCAMDSILLKEKSIYNIPNPIDLDVYKPNITVEARKYFNIKINDQKKLVLFAALASYKDQRKGFRYLIQALEKLKSKAIGNDIELVVLGDDSDLKSQIHGVRTHNLGRIFSQKEMINAYNMADFHVFPTEADNLPNVVKEAAACGVPCVGFNVGGMPDLVKHKDTGYLASAYDVDDLAAGILWMLNEDLSSLSIKAREYAEKIHDPQLCVSRYVDVYRKAIYKSQNVK